MVTMRDEMLIQNPVDCTVFPLRVELVRHFSKPGITGWAQVTGFRGETKELWQMEERIKRDIWYIENWSFWLDIRIIFLTAKSIICPDKNAY